MKDPVPVRAGGMKKTRGSALVELSLTMPMLLMVLVGAADFGRIFFVQTDPHRSAEYALIEGTRRDYDYELRVRTRI